MLLERRKYVVVWVFNINLILVRGIYYDYSYKIISFFYWVIRRKEKDDFIFFIFVLFYFVKFLKVEKIDVFWFKLSI